MKRLLLMLASVVGMAASSLVLAGPPVPTYAFINGRWWDGARYQSQTFYSVGGVLRSRRPAIIDETIDLVGRYVIPPLAEGHNHWLEPARVDEYNACYLADGVYYVRDLRNLPYVMERIRDAVNLPTSVDLVTALQGFTAPASHPIEITDYFVQAGTFPTQWQRDYDPEAEFAVQTPEDVADRLQLLIREHAAYVKVYLSYSEAFDARRDDPAMYGNHRGMDPKLLPGLVRLAHAASLRVIVHIYTVEDFRASLAAGADDIAHLPAGGSEPNYGIEHFKLTEQDARLAKMRGVTVTTTVQGLMDEEDAAEARWNRQVREEAAIPNLRLLKRYGVKMLIGSDQFRHSVLHEVLVLRELEVFTDTEILNMDTRDTARAIFPARRIGRLADGYEANFLVLARDPTQDLNNLTSITLRVKQGRRLTLPAAALNRPTLSCVAEN